MNNKSKLANRALSTITGAIFLISLVAGLAVYYMTDMGISIVLWVVLIIMGMTIAILAPLRKNLSTDFGPNNTDYSLVMGVMVLVVGIAGYIWTFTDLGWLAPVALILVAIAVLAIILVVKNNIIGSD
ncbi:MAG TPA: hypothetical protein VJY42_04080 [Candidatus Methanomethylophilaceae archaeon]|nr:hypothetical protein [Candidatus Methanomethylophilaceae archaeon]